MDTSGKHILAEFWGCAKRDLDNLEAIEELMLQAAKEAGAVVVNQVFHNFSPQGVTGVVVVEESHLSIHTWPEVGYVAIDIYTCGDCLPQQAVDYLKDKLDAHRVEQMVIARGQSGARSMNLREYQTEPRPLPSSTTEEKDSPCFEKPHIISSYPVPQMASRS